MDLLKQNSTKQVAEYADGRREEVDVTVPVLATGVPVLMNTSFNLRGEPLVTTPQNAYSTFLLTFS